MASRRISIPALFVIVIFFHVIALCHEGGKHFMGKVKSVDDTTLTITTTTNETVTFKVLPTTKVVKSGHAVSIHDLKAGERVVVHAKENGTSWEAEEVRLGAAQPQATVSH